MGVLTEAGQRARELTDRQAYLNTEVLIAEDGLDARALVKLPLSMLGYQFRVAGSESQLFSSLRCSGLPGLVLLDVTLPDADGFAVLARLRSQPEFGSLPIVMLTRGRDPVCADKALALGADGCIVKPCSMRTLEKVIESVLA